MATVARKRKTVRKKIVIPPPPTRKEAPLWLQSVAVFVAGVGLGVLLLGPGAQWASALFNASSPVVADGSGDELAPPAFGGLPAGIAGAFSSSASIVSVASSPAASSVAASSAPASTQPMSGAGSSGLAAMLRSRMDFLRITRGVVGGQSNAGYLVALTRPQQDKLWGDMAERGAVMPAAANVALEGKMIVAVFAGQRPDASYAMEVSHVVMTERDIRLFVLETHAGANCVQQFTPVSPYDVVTIDRIDLPLVVVREEAIIDC